MVRMLPRDVVRKFASAISADFLSELSGEKVLDGGS